MIKEQTLIKIQAWSGASFASFLIPHLATHFLAFIGPKASNDALQTFRAVYQSPVIEVLGVTGSVVIHTAAAVIRWFKHRKNEKKEKEKQKQVVYQEWPQKLHTWSGWILAITVFTHMLGARVMPLLEGVETDFNTMAFVASTSPFNKVAIPYFLIFGCIGTTHLVTGALKNIRLLMGIKSSWTRSKPLIASLLITGWTLTVMGVLGYGGYIYEHDQSKFGPAREYYVKKMDLLLGNAE